MTPAPGTATVASGLRLLRGAPDAPALLGAGTVMTYAELQRAVDRTGDLLGPERRLVLLEAADDVATVTTYLAALAGGHPVLLAGPGDLTRHADLVEHYRPDVVQPAGLPPRELRAGTAHDLHPDLAVLLSTSGSTGSPKLVRLSRASVEANARSIADYLAIRPTDRALASLPLHYSYGLSVLNSHLLAGAAVVLTDLSVADECFWALAAETGATSFAGVPHTFELLDASGFERRDLPDLRYVTQAGGRMPPDRVLKFAELGRRRGWDLFVMYGQTEATARIAFLPPDRAAARPTAVGVPIPGGALRVDPVPGLDDPRAGELVYSGPNVMMGYAHEPADLALGPSLAELRTGDLARRADDGLWEIVGRLSRHAKVFGLRLDLDLLEQRLLAEGHRTRIVVRGDRLRVFVDRPRGADRVRRLTAGLASLPVGTVRVDRLADFPRTPSGKTDYAALERQADLLTDDAERADDPAAPVTAASVRDLYAVLLARPDATVADSFVGLGGDSLSFVEVSLRLGARLGHLPAGWAHLSPVELAGSARRRRRWRGAPVETSALLRAVAILLVVVTHADLVLVPGGAHVLLAVAGFNLARFTLRTPGRTDRVRQLLAGLARVALPATAWIGLVAVTVGGYRPATLFYLNGVLGPDAWTDDWQFWFLEALVWSYLGLAALLAVPVADRWLRAHPFGVAMVALTSTVLLRYAWTGDEAGPTERYTVGLVLWCVAIGWAAAEATTVRRKILVTVLAVVATAGFFGDLQREAVVLGGLVLLVWVRTVPVPSALATPVRLVAGASLWIYLTHWQVYPGLEAAGRPVLAILASVAVGIGCCWVVERGVRALRGARPSTPRRPSTCGAATPTGFASRRR